MALLILLCVLAALHGLRLRSGVDELSAYGFRLVQMETIAVWLTLVVTSVLMLIVAVELSIVAWRLVRPKRRN